MPNFSDLKSVYILFILLWAPLCIKKRGDGAPGAEPVTSILPNTPHNMDMPRYKKPPTGKSLVGGMLWLVAVQNTLFALGLFRV